jgi:Right handed beta helix region
MPDRLDHEHRGRRLHATVVVIALLAAAAFAAVAGASAGAAAKKRSSRPAVSRFSFSPSTFSVGAARTATTGRRATTISFTLSRRSTVRISISRKLKGRLTAASRKSARRCVKSSAKLAKRPSCTRYRSAGTIVRSGLAAGKRSVAFSGRVGGKALASGRYRATIVAIDRSHRRSRAKTASFTIVAAQQGNSGANPPSPGTGTPPPGAQRRNIRPCSVTVSSTSAAQSAVSSAAPGTVVCLAPGSYGRLALSANKTGEVVVQPAGTATVAGASLAGAHLTLEGFNVVGDEVTIEPGSNHMTVQFNRISGGHFGIDAGPTTTTTVDDVTIRGNQFIGNFGEDAMRLNRYHDADGDGVGILIEGNEITGVVEDGQHNDCLQTVWVGDHLVFRRNWLHANNCQGFFVKDQASPIDTIVVEDNLIVDHNLPCQPDSLCPTWVLSPVQVFGPLTSLRFNNNTVWTPFRNGGVYMRGSGWGSFQFNNNVTYRLEAPDGNAPFASYSASNNQTCNRTAGWPATGVTSGVCSIPTPNAATDDYRLGNGRGVDWAPADQHYGP